jgi:hypothetical protein
VDEWTDLERAGDRPCGLPTGRRDGRPPRRSFTSSGEPFLWRE